MNKTYTLENGTVVEAVGDIHIKIKEGGALLLSEGQHTRLYTPGVRFCRRLRWVQGKEC